METKLKGSLDWVAIISIGLGFSFPLILMRLDLNLKAFCILAGVIYFLSIFIFRIFTFHDEYYEAYFPTRILFRRKKIYYKELEYVRYVSGVRGGASFQMSKYGHRGFYALKYEVPCLNVKKFESLINFFKTKDISVIVYNKDYLNKKEREILKKAYPDIFKEPEIKTFINYRW